MMKKAIIILLSCSLVLSTGCLYIIMSIHKMPKVGRDFKEHDSTTLKTLYAKFKSNFFVHEYIDSTQSGYIDMVLFFDSTRITWDFVLSPKTGWETNTAMLTRNVLSNMNNNYGSARQVNNIYKLQTTKGTRGLGYYFLYFDMKLLPKNKISVELKSYEKFNKRAHFDPSILHLLNKTILFKAVK